MKPLHPKLKGDTIIWSVIIILSIVSMIAVFSTTRTLAYKMNKDATHYLVKQLSFLVFGWVVMYWVHKINYTKFARLSQVLFFISVPLLIYTLFFGANLNGGARWVRLPVINLTFQSSDFAKLALFMYLARLLSMKQDVIQDLKKGFLPILLPVGIICALIAPANLSTALMLMATCSLLFFIGRVSMKHIFLLGAVGLLSMALIFGISKLTGWGRAETWEKRIETFIHAEDATEKQGHTYTAADDDKFQVTQAKIAIANGGITGLGPGKSLQRDTLPEAYSDFIFASIIEEYGLIGGGVLILLYLLFLWRSILIFRRCPYAFGAFLAVGLSMTLVFQAMLNMAVNVHLVPVTGLTLPMISMGGSSIWFTSISLGIILSVSRYVDEMEGSQKKRNALMEETATPEPATDEAQEEIAVAALSNKNVTTNSRKNSLEPVY